MTDGNDANIDLKTANQEQLLVALYKDLQKSQEQIEGLTTANTELSKAAETGTKPDEKLTQELEDLRKKSEDSAKLAGEYKKLQETMTKKEEDLKNATSNASTKDDELQKLADIVEIQKAKYAETENRLKAIEQERILEVTNKKQTHLSTVVEKYVKLGIVEDTPEAKEAKLTNLMGMSDDAVNEISSMIENKVNLEPAPAVQSSQALQLAEAENVRNDKEKTKEQKLDDLFNMQK